MKGRDKIIEVNGTNISNENHKQVVQRIKAIPNETKLLVVDDKTEEFYKVRGIVVNGSMPNVVHLKTPIPRPGSHGGSSVVVVNNTSVVSMADTNGMGVGESP